MMCSLLSCQMSHQALCIYVKCKKYKMPQIYLILFNSVKSVRYCGNMKQDMICYHTSLTVSTVQFTVFVCTKVICCPLLNKTIRNNHYIAKICLLYLVSSSRTSHSIDREVLVAFIQWSTLALRRSKHWRTKIVLCTQAKMIFFFTTSCRDWQNKITII